jgi:large-conductance mechanosensitive channel
MSRHEKVAYAVAVVILVVGGAIVRTAILNWIVGPLIVVVCVAVAERIATSRRSTCTPVTDSETPT